MLVPRLAADVLPPLPSARNADTPSSSPAKPASEAAELPKDTVLHACDCLWTFLRHVLVLLTDVQSGNYLIRMHHHKRPYTPPLRCGTQQLTFRSVKAYGVQDCMMKGIRKVLLLMMAL